MKILNIIIICLLLAIGYMAIIITTTEKDKKTTTVWLNPETNEWETFTGFSPIPVPTSIQKITPRPTPVPTPAPTHIPIPVYSYDNIKVDHKIELCKPIPTHTFEKLELEYWYTDCGITTFVLDNYPLDMLPSGGDSGIVSDSEMVVTKVTINGGISLIPWESVNVKMHWYDANEYDDNTNNNRLMFYTNGQTANSFNNEVTSYLGRFSWEIDEPGQYYVDIITEYGDARVVFDVI